MDPTVSDPEPPAPGQDHDHGGVFPAEPVTRQRVPAGQALVTMAVALLVASLLTADRLAYTARIQPFGWRHDLAVSVAGAVRGVSDTLFLNRPRQWITAAVHNEDPPPPSATDNVDIARPGAGGVTTTTVPPEFRVPSESDPLRILVAGDSLMGYVGPALVNELEGYPVDVTEDWVISTGLARPDVLNWPAQLKADMAQYDPEVVILGFGGNDMQEMDTPGGRLIHGTPEWKVEYQRRVAQVLNTIEAPGRTVYWIGLPMTARRDIEKIVPVWTRAVKAEVAARPWVRYIDTRKILSPDGTYSAYLRDSNGNDVKVREGDGVHPNLAGATRMVGPVVDSLLDERKLTEARARTATTTTSTSATSTTTASN